MNRALMTLPRIQQTCMRKLSTSSSLKNSNLEKIRKYQKMLQAPPYDVPVYLKAGSRDYVAFYASVILTTISLGMSITALFQLAKK